jgi:hypothetical protein
MMRPFACLFSSLLVMLALASEIAAVGAAPGRLESVNILRAGSGSSLATRTSAVAVLVAATSVDARTVVIELVGIVADRREMAVTDGAGMISHLAIETVGAAGGSAVTRIRVSLARPYRHRVRLSGHLVYIDFERVDPAEMAPAARRRALEPNLKPSRKPSLKPGGDRTTVAERSRPAVGPDTSPSAPPSEVSLLSRWLAVTEPLRHTFDPPSAATVLGRAWIPLVLRDGTTLFSHGDYAEVDGQLTFFLPFDDSDAPRVEAVAVRTSAVDLDATARAAESVRAARYALTRGPREFADLSASVSEALAAVPSEADPVARVRRVESVRQRLVEWPAAHHGYRARDIHEAIGMLDPILHQLRAAVGASGVELSLAAPPAGPPAAIVFRQPTLVDLLENAMRFVGLLPPAQRTEVLRATAETMERRRAVLPAVWFATGQRRVADALKSEMRLDEAYRKLSSRMIERAVRAARSGNVRAVASLQAELLARDQELGGMRQDVLASTMTELQIQFDLAAREQLRRDRDEMEGASRSRWRR